MNRTGFGRGGHRAASIYGTVETAKRHGIDPEARRIDTAASIADHPARRISALPWNVKPVRADTSPDAHIRLDDTRARFEQYPAVG